MDATPKTDGFLLYLATGVPPSQIPHSWVEPLVAHSRDLERELSDAKRQNAELVEALENYKAEAPLCAAHQPSGGTRGVCLICAIQSQSDALSRIDYLCGPPNEMEISRYDVECDESAVVDRVRAALSRAKE